MDPLISVIVPVYNVEDYLDRCVESIVNQTYKNLEIILVDDGSTDESGEKCDKWKQKDRRIVVIHKKNGGLSHARNIGLDIAKGEYIGFVDSDDFVNVNMYGMLFCVLEKSGAEIAECKWNAFENEEDIHAIQTVRTDDYEVYSTEEALAELIKEKRLKQTVWNKLYKRNVIDDKLFPVNKINEDEFWTYRVFGSAKRIVHIDVEMYFYYQRPNSIMHTKYSKKRFDGLDALKDRAEYVKINYPNLYSIAVRAYIGGCMYSYQYLCRQPKSEEYKEYKSILYKRFCDGDKTALFEGLEIKYKMWFTMFRIFPNFTSAIRNKLRIGL